ncbi:Presilphiperfolan-8-beta-ol synthase [Camillea tinctor]|nr:Presilphiperfolan-8-beta-ol synthase [Camillea tinctor]
MLAKQISLNDSPSGVVSNSMNGTTDPTERTQQEYQIRIPDMFASIMASKPILNPNQSIIKSREDWWLETMAIKDRKWAAINQKPNFGYMASIWAPTCDEEALEMMVDWNWWVFMFDDQFDEGHLSNNLSAAKEEIDIAIGIMEETQPRYTMEDSLIRYTFQTSCDRLKKRAGPELREHWKEMHKRYFNGLLEQVQVTESKRTYTRNVEEYVHMRRGTIGAYPSIALVQYALGINLPLDVINHPSLQECMCVCVDFVHLHNDIMSYRKDKVLGVDQNIIMLLMKQGLSPQEAIDKVGTMLNDCYKRWYTALLDMPVCGENIDREVLRFVEACRNVALGNLYWSFSTGRYLGPEAKSVYETRTLTLTC